MNKNFHNSRGSSTNAVNSVPLWRIVIITLVLVLAIGSAGLAPALAAPAAAPVRYRMDSIRISHDGQVCIGEIVHIRVFVYRQMGEIGQDIQYLPGIRVDADYFEGVFAIRNPLSGRGYTAASSNRPGVADYSFQAKKAGQVNIRFRASIIDAWFGWAPGTHALEARERITVVDCQYRVSGVSDFSVVGGFVGGVFKDAVMTLGSDGLYTGTATVKWLGYLAPTLCVNTHYLDPATTEAELTGIIDDQGRFHFNIVYDPGESKWRANCYADFVDVLKLDPWELKFNIPVTGEVGILRYHAISFSQGKTTVTVIQEKSGGQ